MRYIKKLRDKGVTPTEFAKKLGKCKAWGYHVFTGKNGKGDVFLLHPRYYATVKQVFPYVKDRDFFN